MVTFALLIAAQLLALPADRTPSQYVHHGWTVENGLPHGTIRGFAQTKDGYLWLATYEGLVRFNGEKFRIFDKSSNPQIPSNSIVTIARAPDDTLWLGTLAGLMRYRAGRLEAVPMPHEQEIVNAIAVSNDGTVWIGTARGRLLRASGTRIEQLPVPISDPIATLAADKDALWIGTARGLARYRAGKLDRWTSADGLSNDAIVALAPAASGAMWVGTAAGLDRFDGTRFTHAAGLPVDQVTALRDDRDGNLWIGTYSNGVYRLTGEKLTHFGLAEGLLNPTVRSIFEDDEGSLWIGTNGGFEQLRAGAFVNWSERDGLADAVARVIFQDRDGVLWVGSANGVSRWNGTAFERFPHPHLTGILAIAQTDDGAMWFGTSNGVHRLAGANTTSYTTREGLSSNSIRAIHQDRRGDIWIATDFGLSRIRADGAVESIAGRGGLGTDYVMAIAETSDGRVWFATGGGLAMYDGRGFRLHSAPGDLPSNRLFALAAEDDDTLWITTDGDGLLRFRNGKASAITTRHGLPTDKILSLVDDGRGNLWFGTVRGAFRASKRDLNAVADGNRARIDAPLYDENDGLGSRQCNGIANPAALRTRDGRIWLATANGVSALTNVRGAALPERTPVIERVLINGKVPKPDVLRRVPPGADRIEFEFSGVTFVTPDRIHFRYRLDGYDNDWIESEANRVASYTNLPAASYRFELASSRDGVHWRIAAVPFTLRPHFYQTKTFVALILLAVIALLFAIHSMRLHFARERARLLEQLVEERTRQISEEKERTEEALLAAEEARTEAEAARREAERHERMVEQALVQAEEANRAKSTFLAAASHELRTPLNAIIGFSEILIPHVTNKLEPRLTGFLHNIHSSGEYLLGIINNILDLSKIEAGRMEIHPETMLLRDEVGGICAVMKGVTTLRGIRFEVDVPRDLRIDADVTLLKQILYNLMANAVKFSGDRSTVTIAARALGADETPLGEPAVEIKVVDQGVGIDPKDHQVIFQEFRQAHAAQSGRPQGTGLGLALVKRFVDLHRGLIGVDSTPGHGSTFYVTLPATQPLVRGGGQPSVPVLHDASR